MMAVTCTIPIPDDFSLVAHLPRLELTFSTHLQSAEMLAVDRRLRWLQWANRSGYVPGVKTQYLEKKLQSEQSVNTPGALCEGCTDEISIKGTGRQKSGKGTPTTPTLFWIFTPAFPRMLRFWNGESQSAGEVLSIFRPLETENRRGIERATSEAGQVQWPVRVASSRHRRRIVLGCQGPV